MGKSPNSILKDDFMDNKFRTSKEIASLAGKLMHHWSKEIRSLAAVVLANRKK